MPNNFLTITLCSMEELEKKEKNQEFEPKHHPNSHPREEIFSEIVRAGKRTYFFDVKATRAGQQYLTITESKRRFDNNSGKYFYEKHKLFLYKEDFEKFTNGLKIALGFIQNGTKAAHADEEIPQTIDPHVDVEFEDLGNEHEQSDFIEDEKLI